MSGIHAVRQLTWSKLASPVPRGISYATGGMDMRADTSLLPGEELVMSSDNDALTLTNKRVRFSTTRVGTSSYTSITPDSVASCGLVTKSHPVLPLLSAFSFIVGLTQRNEEQVWLLLGSIVLLVAYFLTRRAVISIASNGGEAILVPARGMARAAIVKFLDAVDAQKLA
jgi:hypothetical protein